LNASVKFLRDRLLRFASSMVDTVTPTRFVSTKKEQAHRYVFDLWGGG
jgi:hypothetical protein